MRSDDVWEDGSTHGGGSHGNLEIEVDGKGVVLIAVNDISQLAITEGPAQYDRLGTCGGPEWPMHIEVDGEVVEVPPYESVRVGDTLFTNAGTLTHWRDYVDRVPRTSRCQF